MAKNWKRLLTVLVAVVTVLALLVSMGGCSSEDKDDEKSEKKSTYTTPLDNYIKIVSCKGTKAILEDMYPPEYWEMMDENRDSVSSTGYTEETQSTSKGYLDEAWSRLESRYEYMAEVLEDEYGSKVRFSYEILEKDELDEDDLSDLADALHDNWGVKRKDVKQAYELEVELIIEGSDDEETDEIDIVVVKIGSKWYAYGINLPF